MVGGKVKEGDGWKDGWKEGRKAKEGRDGWKEEK